MEWNELKWKSNEVERNELEYKEKLKEETKF